MMQGMVYERGEGVYKDKPELIYRGVVTRKPYIKAIRYSILVLLSGIGVWYLLMLPNIANGELFFFPEPWRTITIQLGRVVAGILVIAGALRLTVNIAYAILRKPERVAFYDQGFKWEKRGTLNKYGWNAVKTVREDPQAWFFRGKPVLQWGHITLKMRDGNSYKFTAAHGDLIGFLTRVRPHYAAEIGTRMGQMLRQNRTFSVHPSLKITPPGLVVDEKAQIRWENLKLSQDNKNLIIQQVKPDGAIVTIKKIPVKMIDNLAGFLELAEATAETFQRSTPYKQAQQQQGY